VTLHDALPHDSGDVWHRYRRRCSCGWQSGWTAEPVADRLLDEHLAEHEVAGTKRCAGFYWVGQPFTRCCECTEPAWNHDFEMGSGDGPFAPLVPKPWNAVLIAAWLDRGLITAERAEHLANCTSELAEQEAV
jgi:hypothetical protein